MEAKIIIQNENYEISYLDRSSPNVTVAFASEGSNAFSLPLKEFVEEFSDFNSSFIFVRSLHLDWYNNRNVYKTFRALAKFCKGFEKVYALGESIGGSGALLFSEFYPDLHRILALCPQYSALQPFCKWYGALSVVDGEAIKEYVFSDYSRPQALGKSVLLLPAWGYEDALHGRFFKSDGFDVVFLKTTEHPMANYFLTVDSSRNYLQEILAGLYNDEFAFTAKAYKNMLHKLVEDSFKPYARWIGNHTAPSNVYIDKPSYPLISEGKTATQSSVCEHSLARDVVGDAERLLKEPLTRFYNNHTAYEEHPWWQIDLGKVYQVKHIILYNRSDAMDWAFRFLKFSIIASEDGHIWHTLVKKTDNEIVGGEYGRPFSLPCSIKGRYIRVILDLPNVLNIARVEVYGVESEDSALQKTSAS
ncbi:discoidin domain-containing protein [Entomobacter blattae]|uniref:F5/8 type C domain protein n=1 Tax=Entomobacter blattae TaxID=2762277 RepID=A0A7H1NQB4_9PROT|nr:discoidin domain-containing protein [Entomobacter blattae]QNT77974.1 F5/8 type C domain protein [Entomobacter blattae]